MERILVIGSFMMDLVAKTTRAPREGETIIGHSFSQFTGGRVQIKPLRLQGEFTCHDVG